MIELTGLQRPCGKINLSGLEILEYIPADFLAQHLSTYNEAIIEPYQFLPGKGWLRAYVFPFPQYSSKQKEDDQGVTFSKTLRFQIPKDDYRLLAELHRMKGIRYLVRYRDRNGQYRVAGTKARPLDFSFDFKTGRRTGLNGYTLNFTQKADVFNLIEIF